MKQGDIVIYNNKECVINGILYMYDKEPQYTLRDLESGLMINGFVSMDEMEKVPKFAEGGYTIPYSYKPKYADGKTKKDIENLGFNSFGEFDSDDIPASSMQIDANVSYDEARERVEEELKERFSGVLEVDDFWIGDSDVEDEKRVRVRTDIPSEEPELKEIERSGRWDDSYSRLCDELATYEKGGEIDKNKEYKGSVIGFKESGTGRAFHLGDIEIPKNSTPKSIISLAKSKFKRVWFIEVADKNGNYLYEISDDGQSPMVTTYAKGGEVKNGVYEYIELKGTRFEKNRGYTIRADKWNDLIEKGVLDSNDINLADDWRTAIKEENWGKYTRNMYSPKLDRLREQTENEFYNNKLYSKGGSTYAEGKEVYNAHILTNDNKLIHRRYPKKITHNEIYKEYKDKGVEIKDSQIHFAKPIDFFDKLREETKKYVRENMNDDVDSENIFISSMQKGNEYIATEIKGDTISGKSFTITPKDLFEVGFKGNSYAEGGYIEDKELNRELKKGKVFEFNEDEEGYSARVGYEDFYGTKLYYIYFNGAMVHSSKTFGSMLRKLEQLKVDYNLEFAGEEKFGEEEFAKGGSVAGVKKMVYSQSGEYNLEEYQDLSNEDMMGESPMGIEEVKAKVFNYNEEAYDYEDEINEIEDVDDLAEFLYESGLAQIDNTYNQSWWGGVRLYAILNNNGDNFDLDYPTILFMSRHRGGDVRGNYEKYEAFDIEQYGYEQIPFMSATRLTYEVTDGDKKAVFETEDMEGYELYVVESDFVDFDEGDSTNMDEVGEKLGVELY